MSESAISLVERLPDAKANADVVRVLEEFLSDAREGKIVGLAIIGYDIGRFTLQSVVVGENPTLLLGGVQRVSYRISKFIEEHP